MTKDEVIASKMGDILKSELEPSREVKLEQVSKQTGKVANYLP